MIFEATVFTSTKLTEIMDEFTQYDDSGVHKYDMMHLSFFRIMFLFNDNYYNVTFMIRNSHSAKRDDFITFTEMKKGEYYQLRSHLHKLYGNKEALQREIDRNHKLLFEEPLVFKAQSSHHRGKGSTCGGTIQYGEGDYFEMIGLILGDYFPPIGLRRSRIIAYQLFDFE